MSSPMSNNPQSQNSMPQMNLTEFSNVRPPSSTMSGSNKLQRNSRDQTNSTSNRGRHGRSTRGRERINRISDGVTGISEHNKGINPHIQDPPNPAGSSRGREDPHTGRVISYRIQNRLPGGKYKQRQQTGHLLGGMEDLSGLDIDLAESILPTGSSTSASNALRNPHATNSRKVNLTHILNNKFERRQRNPRYKPASPHGDSYAGSHHSSLQYRGNAACTTHKFNKQQFLQANCQFVVLDGHDYSVHKADPDWPVKWECIEEIGFKQIASTQTTCPICLEPPVAAKITRCGHIYCWTCMLHYLSLSDEKCRQCPICFEFVYENDLRSVISNSYKSYAPGDEIEMTLMLRKRGCVEVEPYQVDTLSVRPVSPDDEHQLSSHYKSNANLVIVDPKTVISKITQREYDELSVKYALDRDEPEVCFIEQAFKKLENRVELLRERSSSGLKVSNIPICDEFPTDIDSKNYLFYQCSDGQHIYLNPFSTKILCHQYSKLENCPLVFKAKILQMDWISMNEMWRKRFRYLEHLPLTCEFRLIEIDFDQSELISRESYEFFENQIQVRERQRQQRRREERKREKIIQVEQNRRIYGIQPALKINLDNIDQFPSVSDERYTGIVRTKINSRTSEEESSDEDVVPERPVEVTSNRSGQIEPVMDIKETYDSSEVLHSEVTLSFKDIQIQEAALASKADKEASSSKNAWSKPNAPSSRQSSFAQLLVNAKTSPQQWTRTSGPSSRQNLRAGPAANQTVSPGQCEFDEGDEELRAPPFEFNISEFIDLSSKKKGKLKSGSKRR